MQGAHGNDRAGNDSKVEKRLEHAWVCIYIISPTHKRTEGRAPVWGSEFTSKRRRTTGGDPAETAARLNVKLWLLTDCVRGAILLLILHGN